jgi:hypothetical protein
MKRLRSRTLLVALVAVLAFGALATSALAQSTTMYPAGATLTASSVPVTITTGVGNTTCTLNGGQFVVPSTGNPSGPLTINFTTRPTYTACTPIGGKVPTVTTKETWTLIAQYGNASANVKVPLEGIEISWNGQVIERTTLGDEGPLTFIGGWNNGFTSPVTVGTAIQYGGSIRLWNTISLKYRETPFSNALQSLSSSSSMARLGP